MTTPFDDPAERAKRRAAIRKAMAAVEAAHGHEADADERAGLILDLHDAVGVSGLRYDDALGVAGVRRESVDDCSLPTERLRAAVARLQGWGR